MAQCNSIRRYCKIIIRVPYNWVALPRLWAKMVESNGSTDKFTQHCLTQISVIDEEM